MSDIRQITESLVFESGSWKRQLVAFLLIGGSIIGTILLAASFFPGATIGERLDGAYQLIWRHTTRRQFTEIMRENPWLLIIPGAAVPLAVALVTPLNSWWRAAIVFMAFGIGVVFGHVFW